MEKNLEEKELMNINEKSIFYRIKKFFKNLFKNNDSEIQSAKGNITSNNQINKTEKDTFVETLKKVENEETKLLEIQSQYDNGYLKIEDLSNTQVEDLIGLYKKQISQLKKSNEARKQRLLQYEKKITSN